VQKLEGHSKFVIAMAFSLDDSLLVLALYDRIVRLWNSTTSQEVQKLEGHITIVVAFSSDDSLLALASYDGIVRLWNPTTNQEVQKLEAMKHIRTLSLTNDNKILLTNCGTIDIEKKSISILAPKSSTNQTLMIKDSWIQQDSRNLLRLPQKYRSDCSTFRNNIFAFDLHLDQVNFIELDFSF